MVKALAAVVLVAAAGCAEEGLTPGEQTPAEEEDLVHLRQEEKLARDVYLTLYDQFALQPHSKISEAEQRHMDEVGTLLDELGIEDPITDDTVGAFDDAEISALYTELVTRGSQSEVDALAVGATIEDLDIYDIRLMRDRTENTTILATYDLLECGSTNHMRAFSGQLTARGESYAPLYITTSEYEQILADSQKQCGSGGH